MTVSDVSFASPPVREVNLTIWFEPIYTLAALHLAPLRTEWGAELSRVEEKAPLAGWNPVESISIATDRWPMPACVFASLEREKQVLVQNDRFSLTWYFTQNSHYPGFRSLSAEFQQRYLTFIEALRASENPDPDTTRVTIEYENLLDRFDSNVVARRLVTDEPVSLRDRGQLEHGATAIRRHSHRQTDDSISLLIGVDPASRSETLSLDEEDAFSREAEDADSNELAVEGVATLLTLSGRAEIGKEDDVFERLRAAHDASVELFLKSFDDSLKTAWGEQ